jgi:hypothetical protein
MKLGDRVRVRETASDSEHRGMKATVISDAAPGELVDVEFDVETVTHSFNAADLEHL